MNEEMKSTAMSDEEYAKIWDKPIVRIGVITMILASVTAFLPVIYLCISQGIVPDIGEVMKCWALSAAAWGALYVVEPITYYTVVGLSGTYVAFLTGNLANLRIPCAATALEVTGIEPGTREGEIVSTLGITGSAITSIFFTTLAAFVGAQLLAILPEVVVTAFSNYTVPAIFGAVLGQYALKEPKICLFSIALALIFHYVLLVPSYIAMLACVVLSILFSRLLYNQQKKKGNNVTA